MCTTWRSVGQPICGGLRNFADQSVQHGVIPDRDGAYCVLVSDA
jgi:hypothetical protein